MSKFNWLNLKKRFISAAFIGGIFILSFFVYRVVFDAVLYLVATFMLLEWYDMAKSSNTGLLVGWVAISLSISCLFYISAIDYTGWLLLTYFVIIWTVDVMAMMGGKLIGGKKLAPKISPNKTISGLIVGVASAAGTANILFLFADYRPGNKLWATIGVVFIGVMAQLSDLSVSIFKRNFGIKDSGNIIPGHGGMLDRFDSIILTAPLLALFLYMI